MFTRKITLTYLSIFKLIKQKIIAPVACPECILCNTHSLASYRKHLLYCKTILCFSLPASSSDFCFQMMSYCRFSVCNEKAHCVYIGSLKLKCHLVPKEIISIRTFFNVSKIHDCFHTTEIYQMHVTLNIKLLKHGHVNKNIYLTLSHFF